MFRMGAVVRIMSIFAKGVEAGSLRRKYLEQEEIYGSVSL